MPRKRHPDHLSVRARDVLRFNAFYARRIREGIEATRVHEVNAVELGIFLELLEAPRPPSWLSWRLGVDRGYLSRLLKLLELNGHVTVNGAGGDRRMRLVSLTKLGRGAARDLAHFQEEAARKTLKDLPLRQQRRMVRAMKTIIEVLERDPLTNLLECHTEESFEEAKNAQARLRAIDPFR